MAAKNFQVISPVDGKMFLERPLAGFEEVRAVCARARTAQPAWRGVPLDERVRLCERLVEQFGAERDDIVAELARQMGRPVRFGGSEVDGFAQRGLYMASIAHDALTDEEIPSARGPLGGTPGRNLVRRFIRHEPHGVVLVLAPWNYPYLTAVNSVIPALIAGNAVVLKHSDQTPLCADRIRDAATQAGIPGDVLQTLDTSHETIGQVVSESLADFVAFCGSVAGGHAVQEAASSGFGGVGLELGGKDPAYVRADADLDFTIPRLADGAFFNSGQSCCAVERVYAHASVYDEVVEGLVAEASKLRLGNPLDPETTLGPMVRISNADSVRSQIADAIGRGARPLVDSASFGSDTGNDACGTYLAPQVLVNVDHSMPVMRDETFGPVAGVMAVDGDDDAISLMNDSRYGLTASVWTQDTHAAVALGGQIECGTLFMNRCDYVDPALAWTGVKDSGRGATLSRLGFEQLTRPKSFYLNNLNNAG